MNGWQLRCPYQQARLGRYFRRPVSLLSVAGSAISAGRPIHFHIFPSLTVDIDSILSCVLAASPSCPRHQTSCVFPADVVPLRQPTSRLVRYVLMNKDMADYARTFAADNSQSALPVFEESSSVTFFKKKKPMHFSFTKNTSVLCTNLYSVILLWYHSGRLRKPCSNAPGN